MASNILTPDIILREALYLLHQKMVFGSMIHRKYEDEFKGSGAKIGDEILIRRPNTYKIRKGRVAQPQNTRERFETLKIDNQVGVDMSFTSRELTLDLDDFSERILQPAIATLVSDLEYQLLSMLRDVPMLYPSDISASDNIYDHSAIYDWVDLCGRELDIELAPKTDRHALLNSYDESQIIDLLKGLFGDSAEISKQFTEGKMRRFQGFSHKRTVHMPVYHPGRSVYKTDLLFGSTNTNTTPITFGSIVEGQSHFPLAASDPNDWRKGDIVTLSNLKKVHPETKRVYRQCNASFVVTKDAIAGQNMEIWPAIYHADTKYQNVQAVAETGQLAIYALNRGSTPQRQNLYFHKDAFTMATVDLEMPNDVDFKAQEVHEGISMRIVRKYDIGEDNFPCRIDLLFGFKTLRPELARRIIGGIVD